MVHTTLLHHADFLELLHNHGFFNRENYFCFSYQRISGMMKTPKLTASVEGYKTVGCAIHTSHFTSHTHLNNFCLFIFFNSSDPTAKN
ncbi:unnamed protein product [Malus baccata var. baccata]